MIWYSSQIKDVYYNCLKSIECCFFFFFFQAEDGIRDIGVTGVQTCALPISRVRPSVPMPLKKTLLTLAALAALLALAPASALAQGAPTRDTLYADGPTNRYQIGRASCRERV